MRIICFMIFACLYSGAQCFCQVFTDKVAGKNKEDYKDSIIAQDYPYALPIWGEKVTKMGYDLPYSAGINVNYFWQESELVLSNLNVGFNNGPLHNIDEIIRFNSATASANAINIRPDVWLFPFLNVYGILGKAKTSTAIDAGVWVPGPENSWSQVTSFQTKANFDATILGFGITPTFGVAGCFVAIDMNMAWTDVSALDKPVFTTIIGPRIGKAFKFKDPKRNIAVWVGGFRVNFSSSTNGSINLSEVIPIDGLQAKVDAGTSKVAGKQVEVDNWWNNLAPVDQKNPVNVAKYETANRALATAGTFLNSIDAALNDSKNATVQYSLEKGLKEKWNFIVGSQFQLNKHYMLRVEYGFLGARNQFLTGIQYRFGL